jgi:hypothetical protein
MAARTVWRVCATGTCGRAASGLCGCGSCAALASRWSSWASTSGLGSSVPAPSLARCGCQESFPRCIRGLSHNVPFWRSDHALDCIRTRCEPPSGLAMTIFLSAVMYISGPVAPPAPRGRFLGLRPGPTCRLRRPSPADPPCRRPAPPSPATESLEPGGGWKSGGPWPEEQESARRRRSSRRRRQSASRRRRGGMGRLPWQQSCVRRRLHGRRPAVGGPRQQPAGYPARVRRRGRGPQRRGRGRRRRRRRGGAATLGRPRRAGRCAAADEEAAQGADSPAMCRVRWICVDRGGGGAGNREADLGKQQKLPKIPRPVLLVHLLVLALKNSG